jgi:hypothetical protein
MARPARQTADERGENGLSMTSGGCAVTPRAGT